MRNMEEIQCGIKSSLKKQRSLSVSKTKIKIFKEVKVYEGSS